MPRFSIHNVQRRDNGPCTVPLCKERSGEPQIRRHHTSLHVCISQHQRRIQQFSQGGRAPSLPSSHLSFPYLLTSPSISPFFPLPFALEVGSPLNQLGAWGALQVPPAGSGAKPPTKTNLVHSRAARSESQVLVAIIQSKFSTRHNMYRFHL